MSAGRYVEKDYVLRFTGDLSRIERRPGDVFVLSVPARLSIEQVGRFHEHWKAAWRPSCPEDDTGPAPRLIILEQGMTLAVHSPESIRIEELGRPPRYVVAGLDVGAGDDVTALGDGAVVKRSAP